MRPWLGRYTCGKIVFDPLARPWLGLGPWWHEKMGHAVTYSRVSVPMFDPGAKGFMVRCSCGKTWAL